MQPTGDLHPRRNRTIRAVVVAAAFAVLGLGPAPRATAQEGPEVHSWALAPTGTNPDEPSSRPFLSYDLAPGASLEDSVTLWNYGNSQLTFRVFPTDAFNNDSGGFDALPSGEEPEDLGSWISVEREYVTVPASSRVDIPVRIDVPANARAGDHAGAILASSEVEGVDTQGRAVMLDRRTGPRVYLKVDGPEEPALTIESVHSVYHPSLNPFGGSLDVSYTVRNTGNLRLAGDLLLVVRNPFGSEMARQEPKDLPELLPGNAVTLSAHFDDVTAAFRVSTEVSVKPYLPSNSTAAAVPAGDHAISEVTRSGAAWAIPFSVVIAVVVGWAIWRRLRRGRRRSTAPPKPTGPAPRPAGDRALVG